jgi:hypothetical protein
MPPNPRGGRNAQINADLFFSQVASGGVSSIDSLQRNELIDRPGLYGYRLVNRGNVYEILLPDTFLPPDLGEVIVILDGDDLRWPDALTRIGMRPPKV